MVSRRSREVKLLLIVAVNVPLLALVGIVRWRARRTLG